MFRGVAAEAGPEWCWFSCLLSSSGLTPCGRCWRGRLLSVGFCAAAPVRRRYPRREITALDCYDLSGMAVIAKFATGCAICPDKIRPGDPMTILGEAGSGGWVRAVCHPNLNVAAAALSEPLPACPCDRTETGQRAGPVPRIAGPPTCLRPLVLRRCTRMEPARATPVAAAGRGGAAITQASHGKRPPEPDSPTYSRLAAPEPTSPHTRIRNDRRIATLASPTVGAVAHR